MPGANAMDQFLANGPLPFPSRIARLDQRMTLWSNVREPNKSNVVERRRLGQDCGPLLNVADGHLFANVMAALLRCEASPRVQAATHEVVLKVQCRRSVANGSAGVPRGARWTFGGSPASTSTSRPARSPTALLIWHGFAADVALAEACRGWPPILFSQLRCAAARP